MQDRYSLSPPRRHVAFLLLDLALGGAERNIVELANRLAEEGTAVDLVLIRREGPFLDRVSPRVRIVDLKAGRTVAGFIPLRRYLRRERPTALMSALTPVNIAAVITARLSHAGTRVIVSERSAPTTELRNTRSAMVKIAYRLIPWIYPMADRIVAVSGGVAEDLARLTGIPIGRIDVAYNPVVSADLMSKAGKPVDHRWMARGEPPVIVGAGRLEAQKDFTTLIRAFALVRRRRATRLIIAGDGAELAALRMLANQLGIGEDVEFPGFLSNPYPLMAHAAVFVLSSAWEGLPTVLIEAMACGTPVVATDCPTGPDEILESGRFGRLVPVGDPAALAEAIVDTIDKPPARAELQRRAGDFSAERSVAQYTALLFGDLGSAPGRR
jgi:glycosyltransferase involved in cell wall biosynthesis